MYHDSIMVEIRERDDRIHELEAEVERWHRQFCDEAQTYAMIKDQHDRLLAAVKMTREKCQQYFNAPIMAPEAHAAFAFIDRTLAAACEEKPNA